MPLVGGMKKHKSTRTGGAESGAGRKKKVGGAQSGGRGRKGVIPPQLEHWLTFASKYRREHPGATLSEISHSYRGGAKKRR